MPRWLMLALLIVSGWGLLGSSCTPDGPTITASTTGDCSPIVIDTGNATGAGDSNGGTASGGKTTGNQPDPSCDRSKGSHNTSTSTGP